MMSLPSTAEYHKPFAPQIARQGPYLCIGLRQRDSAELRFDQCGFDAAIGMGIKTDKHGV